MSQYVHGYRVYIDILVGLRGCKTLRLIHLGTCPGLARKWPKNGENWGFSGGTKVNFRGAYLEVVWTISDGCHVIICAWVQGIYWYISWSPEMQNATVNTPRNIPRFRPKTAPKMVKMRGFWGYQSQLQGVISRSSLNHFRWLSCHNMCMGTGYILIY